MPDHTGRRGRERDGVWRESRADSTTQLPPDRAMRARDVARPDDEDIADAEANALVVRRHWKPPA